VQDGYVPASGASSRLHTIADLNSDLLLFDYVERVSQPSPDLGVGSPVVASLQISTDPFLKFKIQAQWTRSLHAEVRQMDVFELIVNFDDPL
jgi:hypothetical protein